MTHVRQGNQDIALLHGRPGENGETAFSYAGAPTVRVLSGSVFHNGIQFRYDKLKYDHGWTAAQLEPIMAMIAQDGFDVVNIPIWWSMVEPSMNVFKWTDIDLCIDWCAKYGLRLEVLWFGHDSDGTSVGQGARLPSTSPTGASSGSCTRTWPIAENEALRAKGTNAIDFYGNDPYTTDDNRLFSYGTDAFFAQGKNFPMIMENYVGNQASVGQKVSAIAGGAFLNFYAAVHPDVGSSDNEALYNYNTSTKVVTRKAAGYVIADLNTALNKISTDLASRKPAGAGGKTLQVYNRTAAASVTSTEPVGTHSFTYATTAGDQ